MIYAVAAVAIVASIASGDLHVAALLALAALGLGVFDWLDAREKLGRSRSDRSPR